MTATVSTAALIGNDTAQAGDIVCRGRSPVFGRGGLAEKCSKLHYFSKR
jgi:hypothetical protein